jgi:hypothetical protein
MKEDKMGENHKKKRERRREVMIVKRGRKKIDRYEKKILRE